jgi:hypothetical protein
MERTKMLNLQTQPITAVKKSYAQQKNQRFNNTASQIRSIEQRWNDTYNSLPWAQQQLVDTALNAAIAEFRRRNPTKQQWSDLFLAEAKDAVLNEINIDGTMQRQLDIFWVLTLLNNFMSTMVVPIQVYRPMGTSNQYLAWDGQHTVVLLWLIATKIMGLDPATVTVPVNLYHSNLKAEMRANFISLNSKEGKKLLELIDIFEQQVYGAKIDGSTNPIWQAALAKQQVVARHGLFITAKKFGDDDQPGAITRLQEVNKLDVTTLDWLCEYLAHSTQLQRPVEEKEMVMMAHYFDRCRLDNVAVDSAYIAQLANNFRTLFNCDFSPQGKFWSKASVAYHNWHSANSNGFSLARFNKEPVHGFPFLVCQMMKSVKLARPRNDSKSNFWPDVKDLF